MKFAVLRTDLAKQSHEELEKTVLNAHYNDFCSSYADGDGIKEYLEPSRDKAIPYMGWFWRSVNFFDLQIPIGKTGDFVGFMENNKWGHAERDLTEDEARHLIELLDKAISASRQGGQLSETYKKTAKQIDQIKNYLDSLADIGEWEEAY